MGKCLEAAKAREERNQLAAKATERISELGAERLERLKLAEDVLISRASTINESSNRWAVRLHFSADELLLFDGLGWDDDRVRSEAGRCATVALWQDKAGTTADREAASAALSAAEEKLAKEQPKLEETLATVRRQLQTLQGAVKDSAATVEKQRQAVERLRDQIPRHLEQEHEKACAALSSLKTELQEKRTRLQNIERIQRVDLKTPDSRREANQIAQTWAPELVRDNTREYIDKPGWAAFAAEVAKEVEPLKSDVARLGAELTARQAAADEILKHYVR